MTIKAIFFVVLIFSLSTSILAQSESKKLKGSVVLESSENGDKLTIKGAAADALYTSLLNREGIATASCGGSTSVAANPVLCVKALGRATECYLEIGAQDVAFRVGKLCKMKREPEPEPVEGPLHSIIGVGNFDLDGDGIIDEPTDIFNWGNKTNITPCQP